MFPSPKFDYSVEQYLRFERTVELRHEHRDGALLAILPEGKRHVLVVTNVAGEFSFQLKGRPCKVYSTDMRLRVSPTGFYTYPDVMVVCGEPQFEDDRFDMLLTQT